MEKKTLYIHIPFCRNKCLYCDFYSINIAGNEVLSLEYIRSLCRQIESREENFFTIYVGGGTPTVLKTSFLKKLLRAIKRVSHKAVEFTVEANPDSFSKNKAQLFFDEGVNRISLGVQSFNDQKLKALGRIHSGQQAEKAVLLAKKTGFKNISLDLMFGVPQEEWIDWKKDLAFAVSLPVTHISAYTLTCEKNTPFSQIVRKGIVRFPDDIVVSKLYRRAMEFLPANKFRQYEISNFSQAGYACRHNLHYWENGCYVGLGPAAVSYENGVRFRNVADLRKYMNLVKSNLSPVVFREKLSLRKRAGETAAIKIRTAAGINFTKFRKKTGFDFLEIKKNTVTRMIKFGLLCYRKTGSIKTGICLTKKGFLFCDTVSEEFL